MNVKFLPNMCQLVSSLNTLVLYFGFQSQNNCESLIHLAVDTGQHSALTTLINFRVNVNITNKVD